MTGTHHPLLVLQTLAGLPEPSDLRWNRPDAMLEWRGRTAAKRFGWSTWTSSRHAPPVGALSAACADVREDYVLLMILVDLGVRGQAADADGGGADAACGWRRDGASWLAWLSIRAGRYVSSSEDLPGQPVALECPERPRGDAGPAAEFTGQFCFCRQPGPRRVFAAPDPPREHGVNVQVGLRVLPWIIHDQPHGQCRRLQAPADCTCSIWNTRARPHLRMICARVTTTPGRRQKRAFSMRSATHRSACRTNGTRTLSTPISGIPTQMKR